MSTESNNNTQSLKTYLIVCFALSIITSLLVYLTGGPDSKIIGIGYLTMFFPAIAILILDLVYKVPFPQIAWGNLPIKWFLLGIFLFPIIIHAICLPVVFFQNGNTIPWQQWLITANDGLYHSPTEKNWGTLTKNQLIIRLLLNAFIGIIVVTFLAFYEEIGWRAWMLPKLMNQFSYKKGIIISAIIATLWHIPYILSGIHHIEHVPKYIVLLVNPLGLFGVNIVFAWLWTKTKSIWVVSFAHGSLNNWGQYAFKYMEIKNEIANITLLISLNLTLFIVGIIVLYGIKNNTLDNTKAE